MDRPSEWCEGRTPGNIAFHESMDKLEGLLTSLGYGPAVSSVGTTTVSWRSLRVVVGASGAPQEVVTGFGPAEDAVVKWAVLTTVREMHQRRQAAESLSTGQASGDRWAFEPGMAPFGVREDPENKRDGATFDQLFREAAYEGSQTARATLREYVDGAVTVTLTFFAPSDAVMVTVDSSLLVRRLVMHALRGADQRIWWLLRAAGIAHHQWERGVGIRFLEDLPQFSDHLPGQPSFLDLLGVTDAGWPPEDALERADREEFLAEAVIRTPAGAVA